MRAVRQVLATRSVRAAKLLVGLRLAMAAAVILALAVVTAVRAAGVAAPVRIQFERGASSASLPVELPRGAGATTLSTLSYVLAGRAGQVLEVSLRLPAKDPSVTLSVRCPGDGHTAVGRSGRLDGSVTLPQTGDYTLRIDRLGSGPVLPGTLTVAITGAPRMIAARPYTGTYYRDDGSQSSVDVQEMGGGRLRFSLLATWGAPDSAFGPNLGEAQGVVELRDGAGVFERAGCRLELRFGAPGSGALHVDESGDCGFGHNVTARGDYHRTSLCAAPAEPR
jgi:hypothetical protein